MLDDGRHAFFCEQGLERLLDVRVFEPVLYGRHKGEQSRLKLLLNMWGG
jgi:hypothetical protein